MGMREYIEPSSGKAIDQILITTGLIRFDSIVLHVNPLLFWQLLNKSLTVLKLYDHLPSSAA